MKNCSTRFSCGRESFKTNTQSNYKSLKLEGKSHVVSSINRPSVNSVPIEFFFKYQLNIN